METGGRLHCTLLQAVGKIPVDVNKMNIDLMSISGHKVYGPKVLLASPMSVAREWETVHTLPREWELST